MTGLRSSDPPGYQQSQGVITLQETPGTHLRNGTHRWGSALMLVCPPVETSREIRAELRSPLKVLSGHKAGVVG
jgi:hypothetical protein